MRLKLAVSLIYQLYMLLVDSVICFGVHSFTHPFIRRIDGSHTCQAQASTMTINDMDELTGPGPFSVCSSRALPLLG